MRLKRAIDIFGAAVGLCLLSPVLLVTAIAVRVRLGRPILFRQVRAGYRGHAFHVLKFRTMSDARDEHGRLLPDAERMTPLGNLMRSLSIDELPQLWNVLRGDMSLIGPRPLPVHYLPRYSPEQARRHEVRPGISGWAQVNGRNSLDWQDRFRHDVWYVDNWSHLLDLKIILSTLHQVLRREGISSAGEATCAEFTGNEPSAR